jgi:hypothetical protein
VFAIAVIAMSAASCGDENPQDPGEAGGAGESPVDTTPPSAVADLIVQVATQNTLALQWPSPGDDGVTGQADRYDLRHSHAPITADNWDAATPVDDDPAPNPGGSMEIFVVKGLIPGKVYYFALKTYDEVQNESALSNCAHGETKPETEPPAKVTDLRAAATGDTEFRLTWTATGDDGMEGTATEYDIRYSDRPLTAQKWTTATQVDGEPSPGPAGTPESTLVSGLNAGTNYYFALEVLDDALNESEMSNSCPGLAMSEDLLVVPSVLSQEQYDNQDGIHIIFRNHSPAEMVEVTISRMEWNSIHREYQYVLKRHLVDGNYPPGAHTVVWDRKGDGGSVFSWNFLSVKIDLYRDGLLIASLYARVEAQ